MTEYVIDTETNGLNPDKIHCMVIHNIETGEYKRYSRRQDMKIFVEGLKDEDYLICHNIVLFDSVVLKKLLDVDIKAKLVDTLALSWYLFVKRVKHGLASWGDDFDVPKPVIKDWDNLTVADYINRCVEDVRINTLLWNLMKEKLEQIYGGSDSYWGLIEYLTFKMDCMREQEEVKWKLDVPECIKLFTLLEEKQGNAKQSLQSVMPKVKKYTKKKRPAKPFKIDKTLSKNGEAWKAICAEYGKSFDYEGTIEVFHSLVEPNASSSKQIKAWLFDLGWTPETYKFIREGEVERKIEQIKKGDELCPSVLKLIPNHPELQYLDELGVLTHRIGVVKGFLRDEENGYIVAGIGGLTNTLRVKHRTCVNIPSPRAPYGSEIRGLLTSRGGFELVGSDMSNLEGRIKEHYVYPHDPDYVESVNAEGYDGHLEIAVQSGMMEEVEAEQYRSGDKTARLTAIRHNGKTANYACQYGAGVATIARQTGLSQKEAKKLHTAYWKINQAVKVVAAEQEVKVVEGSQWLYNPVSGFWYSLRSDKDRFSTLVQGTGTYCFDMWVKELRAKGIKMIGQFHDECISQIKEGYRDMVTKDFKEAVQTVNKKLNLNRELDVDVEFGNNYSEIH